MRAGAATLVLLRSSARVSSPSRRCGPQFCTQSPQQMDGPPPTRQRLMESLETIMRPETRVVMTDRWDWHLWQFFTALLPACAVLAIADWADRDMEAKGLQLAVPEAQEASKADAEREQEAKALAIDQEQVRARLDAIERRLEEIASRQSQPAASKQPPASGERKASPTLASK